MYLSHQLLILCYLLILPLVIFAAIVEEESRQLIRRLKGSDAQAFRSVFDLFHEPIYRFLQFTLKDNDVAEDLGQEVFVKLWENRHQLNEKSSLKSYLYTIAKNLALNHFRHEKVVQKHQLYERRSSPKTDSPETELEHQEFRRQLRQAINQLPAKARMVFLMSRIEQLSHKEIAELLDISVKTVESHITTSLKTLLKQLYR